MVGWLHSNHRAFYRSKTFLTPPGSPLLVLTLSRTTRTGVHESLAIRLGPVHEIPATGALVHTGTRLERLTRRQLVFATAAYRLAAGLTVLPTWQTRSAMNQSV